MDIETLVRVGVGVVVLLGAVAVLVQRVARSRRRVVAQMRHAEARRRAIREMERT